MLDIIGTIRVLNSYNLGNIKTSPSTAGGIIGQANNIAVINNSYNSGEIYNSSRYVGGIIANGNNLTINKCYNIGNIGVIGKTEWAGGIVGEGKTVNITNCYNAGKIQGYSNIGGIVTRTSDGNITNCYNIGEISTLKGSYSGGIAYGSSDTNFKYCYNSGMIQGNGYIGGITFQGKDMEYCYNSGNIQADSFVGGIAYDGKKVANCYNAGQVDANWQAYGISMGSYDCELSNCYNSGNIKAPQYVAGIAYNGKKVENCYNSGEIGQLKDNVEPHLIGGILSSLSSNGTITNCHNTGRIMALTSTSPTIGEIVGDGNVGADCTYLIRENNAPDKGATGKTEDTMLDIAEIMSIQNYVNTINAQIRENNANPDNVQLCEWTVKDGKPVLVWD